MSPEPVAAEVPTERHPRDNLVRAQFPGGVELREAEADAMPTMAGHFAVFNQWARIDSVLEGRFMERIAPGAFARALADKRDRIRVLFQHGQDPSIGMKVLGVPSVLREDKTGGYYEVPLLDTSYNRDLLPGLRAGVYGSSFRFNVMKEEWNHKARASSHNPDGLSERTIQEVDLPELGPVTFPAYVGATVGVRSLTDEFVTAELAADPDRLIALIQQTRSHALPDAGLEAEPHSDEGTRDEPSAPVVEPVIPPVVAAPRRFRSDSDWTAYLQEFNR